MKKKSTQFDKFSKKKSNAAVKEEFKQQKRKWKKEREEFFIKKKQAVRRPLENEQAKKSDKDKQSESSEQIPLNKFIAHCGICARRDAAEMVKSGTVKVNKVVIIEPGHKVSSNDEIFVNGKKIFLSKNLVYILLNKPKDYITTTHDPQGRKTVLDIIRRATTERVYPVGRLDRNTSGVLLCTNDGALAQKLTHPSTQVKKIYAITLNKPFEKNHFEAVMKGINLEDGIATVDVLAYSNANDKTQLGVEIHSGKNRIVRRIFEHLGYEVETLDRVLFAGLTKKNVSRGHWRFLNEKEIRTLKHFDKSIR
ncbi:MAG: rRNA pseudouridine synthase [Chitinophagaceae bacterium]|nr:MAG: rRNA pseudouridine synthase [Chitinophagaceae bacterium]